MGSGKRAHKQTKRTKKSGTSPAGWKATVTWLMPLIRELILLLIRDLS
ncbi:hypothetical protein [Isoptericola sp. NPDC056134]